MAKASAKKSSRKKSSGPKIVFMGGGSTQFTPMLLVDFIQTRELYGSTIVLVDIDEKKLENVYNLAKRLIEAGNADYKLQMTTDRKNARKITIPPMSGIFPLCSFLGSGLSKIFLAPAILRTEGVMMNTSNKENTTARMTLTGTEKFCNMFR